jgi:hypothetical protein
LGQSQRGGFVQIAGQEFAPGNPAISVGVNTIAPEYLRLMRIALLRGREFAQSDRAGARRVAIINRTMAERYWPRTDPVGQVFLDGLSRLEVQIVGVAADSRFRSLAEPPQPFVYYPLAQNYEPQMFVHVRTSNPADVLRELPALIRTADPAAAVFDAAPRRHELAIRTALGAAPAELLRMVAREGGRLIVGGALIGLAAALALAQLLTTFLFGVSPIDPVVLGAAVVALGVLLLLACVVPARRALRLEPMKALRE